ncbi:MAG: PorV/PorQ family protein [bacterium]
MFSSASYSQNDGSANTGLSFLKLGVGARAIAMGEAYSSITEDATAFFYNPARLNFGNKSNVTIMHNASIQDMNTDYIAVKFPLSGKLSMGVGLLTTSVNDIEIRNIPGTAIDKFDARNLSTGISLGYKINPNLSVGVTGKFLYEKIYTDEASGMGFDFGTNYTKDNYSLAFVVANLGSVNELKNKSSKLPSLVRFGGSYKFTKDKFGFNIGAEGFKILDGGKFHAHAGGEVAYKDFAFLRAGYQSGYENRGITTGIGFKYKALHIDYAFVPYTNEFGTSNTFSLGINF